MDDVQTLGRCRLVIPSARIMVAPEAGAHTDTQMLFGEDFDVLGKDGTFTNVHALAAETKGWTQLTRAGFEPARTLGQPTDWVMTPRAPIFLLPDAKSARVGILSMNSRISAGERRTHNGEEFVKVQCFASGPAWVRSDQLSPIGEFAADFVAEMEKFIGTLYGWGERDANPGIDCSRILSQSLLATGWTSVPPDTKDQVRLLGVELDPGLPLDRGDMVFWKGHVAVMVDDKHCIHATDVSPYHCVLVQPLRQVVQERLALGLGQITLARRFPEYAFR